MITLKSVTYEVSRFQVVSSVSWWSQTQLRSEEKNDLVRREKPKE